MNVLWIYRVFTFALASILSLVVIVLCVQSNDHLQHIESQLRHFVDTYAHVGIAVGAITLVSKVILLVLDFFIENIFTSYIVFEVAWSSLLWILWIVVGATTLSNGKTIFQGVSCSELSDIIVPEAKTVCDDIHPIASVAFVTFALLFLYSGVLLVLAFTASGSTPPWTTSLKNRSK